MTLEGTAKEPRAGGRGRSPRAGRRAARAEPGLRGRILAVSEELVRGAGAGALTFEAVARRLGVSKQAVIYWFATKEDLIREIALPAIRAEAAAAIAGIEGASGPGEAVEAFVRALIAFHLADLGRFRLMYLAAQLSPRSGMLMSPQDLADHVHPVTGRMYGALAERLRPGPGVRRGLDARRTAFAAHSSALGLLLMVAFADAVADPLAHPTQALADALVAMLRAGVEAA